MNTADRILIEFTAARVPYLLLTKTKNRTDAEDLSQTVFQKCLRRYMATGAPLTVPYIRKMAFHEFVSWLRKKKTRRECALTSDIECERNPCTILEKREQSQLLVSIVDSLPPKYRQAARMCFLDGQSADQVAIKLEMCLHAVKSRIHRARMMIRIRVARFQTRTCEI